MSIDDELTRIERSYARMGVQMAEAPRWMLLILPGMILASAALNLWLEYRIASGLPYDAFWRVVSTAFLIGAVATWFVESPRQRALGIAYRRLTELEGGTLPTTAQRPEAAPAVLRSGRPPLDVAGLRAACLVAFASGLLVCAVALWRFGSGEVTPVWAGIAMGAAGGLGAGAALVASFLPRWMERAARAEARGAEGAGP